jgi:chlorite dismutase
VQKDFYKAAPNKLADIIKQLSLKDGLKKWGAKAFTAAHSKMKQLHLQSFFKPKHWRELTASQRQIVLESHIFLKEKRYGKVKVITVAGGNNKQD